MKKVIDPIITDTSATAPCTSIRSVLDDLRRDDIDANTDDDDDPINILINRLKVACDSLDGLVDLFEECKALLSGSDSDAAGEVVLDRASAYGIYVRRRVLGFEELSFEAVGRLWQALCVYCDLDSVSKRNDNDDLLSSAKKSVHVVDVDWPETETSVRQLIQQQCLDFNRITTGQLSFYETEEQIQRWALQYPQLPALHFLQFLNCLRHGERIGVLDSLHRYFDYAMIHERRSSSSGGGSSEQQSSVRQYAATVLTALHHEMNNSALARNATDESIRISQQRGDNESVAYALSWLYIYCVDPHVSQTDTEDILQRCVSRARENDVYSLALNASSVLTRHLASPSFIIDAPQIRLDEAWSSLTGPLPSIRRTAEGTNARVQQQSNVQTPISNAQLDREREDTIRAFATRHLAAAGLCDGLDRPSMSSLEYSIALNCHEERLSSSEYSDAFRSICENALNGPCKDLFSLIKSREQVPQAESNSEEIVYVLALKHLLLLQERCPNHPSDSWCHSMAMILHEWAVRRCDFSQAKALWGYLYDSSLNDNVAVVRALGQHAFLLSRQKRWNEAKVKYEKACSFCRDNGLHSNFARFLLELASIQLESCPDHPFNALPPLLECLSLCERLSMDCLHASGLALLGRVHLQLGSPKEAVRLIKASLPILCQHAPLYVQGQAWLTLAKANAEIANDKEVIRQRLRQVQLSISQLDEAIILFRQIEDFCCQREAYYLQARLYDFIPSKVKQRNEAARQFNAVCRRIACAKSCID